MLKIGDLSRLARVSVKALRHYDEIGLLTPDFVEPSTSYRYYSSSAVERLQRIAALKDIGFSLDAIRSILEAGDDSAAARVAFEDQQQRLKAGIAADKARLRRLEAYLADPASVWNGEAPTIRTVEPILAHTDRRRVHRDSDAISDMFEAAEIAVAKAGARADASPFLLFHDDGFHAPTIDVEVCIPVTAGNALRGVRCVEGHRRAATATYRGSYERTDSLYGVMLRWLGRGGYAVTAKLREVYHRFGADQRGYRLPARMMAADADDYITELLVPIR